jgi:hypothetical protein
LSWVVQGTRDPGRPERSRRDMADGRMKALLPPNDPEFVEDADDDPTSVSAAQGLPDRGAAGAFASGVPAWSHPSDPAPLHLILSHFRC